MPSVPMKCVKTTNDPTIQLLQDNYDMRVHVYHEEKSGSYRVFFFFDKQRCLGSFSTKEQADLALKILYDKVEEDGSKDKDRVDDLVQTIRTFVRGNASTPTPKKPKKPVVKPADKPLQKKVQVPKPKPAPKPKKKLNKDNKEDECMLLLSALDNPTYVLEQGYPFLQDYDESDIQSHWNDMLDSKTSNGSSDKDAFHVLQTCMVLSYEEQRKLESQCEYEKSNASPSKKNLDQMEDVSMMRKNVTTEAIAALKGNVLMSNGWYILPLNMVNKRSAKNDPFQSSHWHKMTVKASNMTEKEFVKSSFSLKNAWKTHLQELRNRIVMHLPHNKKSYQAPAAPVQDVYEEAAWVSPKKGVKKGRKPKLEPGAIPRHVQNMMAARARFVTEGDPRPSMKCTWCGPKHWSRKQKSSKSVSPEDSPTPSESAHIICKACQLLYRAGWRMDDAHSNSNTLLSSTANSRRWADYVFRNKNKGVSLRSVKTFLLQTSPYVANICVNDPERLNDMEEIMVISKSKKERISNTYYYSGDFNTSTTKGRTNKRRKIVRDEDTSDDEHSIDSASYCSYSSSTTISDDENHDGSLSSINKSAVHNIVTLPSILSATPNSDDQALKIQRNLKLPTIDDLLKEEYGLSGIIQSDEYGILNHFGSDAEIVCRVLAPLTTGKLPWIAYKETPLLRSKEELDYLHSEGGPPPSRFMGVTRIFEKTNVTTSQSSEKATISMRPNGKFGVEVPLLFFKERKIILREFDREDVAGILFAFLYRLLFGSKALQEMSFNTNDKYKRKDIISDTLCAFGADTTNVVSDDTKMDAAAVDGAAQDGDVVMDEVDTTNVQAVSVISDD